MSPNTATPSPAWIVTIGLALVVLVLLLEPLHGQGEGDPNDGIPTSGSFPQVTMGGTSADSNRSMIAVTGVDITGASILYLVDTERNQIAVYQANGGSEGTQEIKFVGARRIDLDLQLDGFNDKSKYSYRELEEKFVDEGLMPADQR